MLRRVLVKVKQRLSVIGWVTKKLLSRASPCLGRHVTVAHRYAHLQLLTPINPHWARVAGYGPFSLCVIHMEGLCPSIRDINRLMMMMGHKKLTVD
jgi:hypothetical protein